MSIVYCQLAVNTLQLQGLCKLSLVTFNCHFIYFVMQLTVCICPKLPLLIVFYPLTLTPYPLPLIVTGHTLLIRGCQFGITCYNGTSLSYRGKSSSSRLQLTCHCFLLETSNQNLVSFTFVVFFSIRAIQFEIVVVIVFSSDTTFFRLNASKKMT